MAKNSLRDTYRILSRWYNQVWTSSHNYRMSCDDRKKTYWLVQTLEGCTHFMNHMRQAEADHVGKWAIETLVQQSASDLEAKQNWFKDLPKFLQSDEKSYHEFCGTIIGFIGQTLHTKANNSTALTSTTPTIATTAKECLPGSKYDSGKPRFSLLPLEVVNEVVDVLEFGATKYAVDNWQKVTEPKQRYYDAALRHIFAWFGGEKLDPETGKHHLAHGICCLAFLLWLDVKGKL